MPRRSTTPYAVLAMLSLGPRTGYEITRLLAFSVGHFWAESNGQLYPALRSLVAARLATVGRGRSGGRRRITYTITPDGRDALARWLEQPAALPVPRNELLLKLFVGWHTGVDVSLAQVERMRSALADQHRQFDAIRRGLDAESPRGTDAEFWRITVRAGEAVTAARLAWCDETLTVLRGLARARKRSTIDRSRRMNDLLAQLEQRLAPEALAAGPRGLPRRRRAPPRVSR